VKLGNNVTAKRVMLSKTYVTEAIKKSSVFEWQNPLPKGQENVKYSESSGRDQKLRCNENDIK
jgi:hypothetical protein